MLKQLAKYRLHRGSGQALVQFNGRRIYLGKYDSAESHEQYRRLIAQYLAGELPEAANPPGEQRKPLTVNELIVEYFRFAKRYYVKEGKPTCEVAGIRVALRRLRKLYGRSPARDFGPKAYKLLRESMIQEGLSRRYINDSLGRIRRMYRWASSEEMLPITVYQSLATVPGLREGRSEARETAPVRPIADEDVDAVLPHLPAVVADMVRVQRLCGCRPQEVRLMRPMDIDRTEEIWRYVPSRHKTQHKQRVRTIAIGPKAQSILRPYLLRSEEAYCFSPTESESQRNADRRELRSSPLTPSQANRQPKKDPKRPPLDCYSSDSYRRSIQRACKKAGVSAWSPNQLRHTAGTEIRRRFGLEAAQSVLGHAQADVTQIYAERDFSLAEKVMRDVG